MLKNYLLWKVKYDSIQIYAPRRNFSKQSQNISVSIFDKGRFAPQGADPPHPFVLALRKQVEIIWTIYPLPVTGIGEWYSQTTSNLCQVALLRRCELPH
jgi:hypothetical protein